MRGSLRRDRMIGATVTSGFAWFAAWVPLSLGLGLFFGPPGVSLIEFAVLVAASVWLLWDKPLFPAGWFPICAPTAPPPPSGALTCPRPNSPLPFFTPPLF